jgi:PAS domain S-box-containing protein
VSIGQVGREGLEQLRPEMEGRRIDVTNADVPPAFADPTVLRGADGYFFYVTPFVETVLGYTPQELVGRAELDLVHPEDRPARAEAFRRMLQAPHTVLTSEYRVLRKDGGWAWIEVVEQNLLSDPGVGSIVAHQWT